MPFDAQAFENAPTESGTDNLSTTPQAVESVQISNSATPALSPTAQQSFGQAITYGLPGIGLGLLDTLGQSLGILNDHEVPDAFRNLTGSGEGSFGDFYARNQQPLRTMGEIGGMFLPGLAAMKALKSVKLAREAGQLGEVFKNSTAFDYILGTAADLSAKESAIANATIEGVEAQGVWAGRSVATPAVNAAKRSYYASRAVDAARTTVAFELGNRIAFNSSDTFYPADYTLTDQAKWAGIGLGVGIGLDLIAAKYAVRNLVQTAIQGYGKQAAEYGTLAGVAGNPYTANVTNTIFRPGDRGVGVTQYAALSSDLKATASVSPNATLKTNLAQDQINIKGVLVNQIKMMAYDGHPILPRATLDDGQIQLTLDALTKNNTSLLFAKKLGNVPEDGAEAFYKDISKQLTKATDTHNSAQFAATTLAEEEQPAALKKAYSEFRPIQEASSEIHYVLESDGSYQIYKNRADNYLDRNSFKSIRRDTYFTPISKGGITENMKNSKLSVKADNLIVLHDNFRAEIPAGATSSDYSALYAAGSKMIQEWKPVEGQEFVLTPQLNWRTVEMTLALADKYPEAKAAIKLGAPVIQDELTLAPINYIDNPGGFQFGINKGEHEIGSVHGTYDRTTKRINIKNVTTGGGANSLGPTQTKSLLAQLQTKFPDAASVGGERISGARGDFYYSKGPEVSVSVTPVSNTRFTSLDDARFFVLNEKFKEFQKLMPSVDRKPLVGAAAAMAKIKGTSATYTPAQVLQRLNLPQPLGFQPSPLIETFAHAKLQNMTSLDEMFPVTSSGLVPAEWTKMDLLQAHMRETLGIQNAKQIVPTSGTLLSQKDIRPVFVSATSTPPISRSDAMIAGMVEAKRDVQLERLGNISPQESPLVSGVMQKIVTENTAVGRDGYVGISEGSELAGGANQARAVQTLQDGLVSGQGQLVYQDRINDQFPTLKAAQLIAQNTDKFVDNYVATLASRNLTPRVASILAPKAKADLLDFNRIEQSYRHGWEIGSVEPAPTGDGFVFRLKEDSKINQKLLDYHFGGSVDTEEGGLYMPDMSVTALKSGYSPLTVSKNASSLASAISDMSRQSGVENNSLRVALGKNAIKIRDFHLPSPELNRTGTWFVRNDTGNVIATYTGDLTSTNEKRAKDAAQKLIEVTGSAHTAVPLDDVQRDHAIFDDNFFDVIDYSDQLAKTGKGITGGLARTEIDTGDATLRAMVKSLNQQYLNIGVRARAAIFEPELNYARQAANTTSRDNLAGFNIFDRYISTMFSQSPNSSKGAIGGLYNGIESALDKSLSWLSQYHSELTGGPSNTLAAKTMKTLLRKQSSAEEFAQFEKVLPAWNPLNDANKFAESTFREKLPWTSRPVMAKLSKASSTLALRFLDVGTAINNFAGLMTNAPSVVAALRRLPSESHEQWINRTAAWGTQYADGVMTFSPMKAMSASIGAYWRGELNAAMTDAAKHGYFEPEYASLAKVLTTPIGSRSMQKLDSFTQAASYLADHSEIMSRKLAWGMGYKIGKDLHGFTDDRNAYIFANNFVNDMIGNYSPNNKPAMFQGAVGLPLGAFQTYMFNFGRRLYGMVERQDVAALTAQYFAQSAMFGAKSVPGYQAWNAMFQTGNNGDDFQGRLDRTLHPGVSELLLNGSLSNIPKIFGLQNDGLAFFSRGSTDFTNIPPTVMDWQRAPPIQFLTAVAKGVNSTVNNVFSNEGFSVQQQEEILARFSTNRAMKSIMEMAADVKTDARGDVIQASTRDAIHVAAAILGTQPSSTRRLQDASNRERVVQLTQEDLRTTLNDHTRAMFRGGEFDLKDLQGLVHDYTRSGGNPAYLGQWFRNTFTTSMTPKAYSTLEELGRSGKMLEFENMLAAIQQNQPSAQSK